MPAGRLEYLDQLLQVFLSRLAPESCRTAGMLGSQTCVECCAEAQRTRQNGDSHGSHASDSKAEVEGIAHEGSNGKSQHELTPTAGKAEGSTGGLAAPANRSTDGAAS